MWSSPHKAQVAGVSFDLFCTLLGRVEIGAENTSRRMSTVTFGVAVLLTVGALNDFSFFMGL